MRACRTAPNAGAATASGRTGHRPLARDRAPVSQPCAAEGRLRTTSTGQRPRPMAKRRRSRSPRPRWPTTRPSRVGRITLGNGALQRGGDWAPTTWSPDADWGLSVTHAPSTSHRACTFHNLYMVGEDHALYFQLGPNSIVSGTRWRQRVATAFATVLTAPGRQLLASHRRRPPPPSDRPRAPRCYRARRPRDIVLGPDVAGGRANAS